MVHLSACVCGGPYRCVGCGTLLPTAQPTVIAYVLHNDPACRRSGGGGTEASYERVVNDMLLSHASLRLVHTTLPVHVLLSGWHNHSLVALLRSRGIQVHGASPVPIPVWSKLWYRCTFAKLRVLQLAATLRRRVLYLDTDVVAFTNVDHLALAAAPAFVFRDYRNFTTGSGLNSGVFLVPSLSRGEAAGAMHLYLNHTDAPFSSSIFGFDGGDQTFFNAWLLQFPDLRSGRQRPLYELSAMYNVYANEIEDDGEPGGWWRHTKLWHKPRQKDASLPARAKAYIRAHVARAQREAPPHVTFPSVEPRQPVRWCDSVPLLELYVRAPPIHPAFHMPSFADAKTAQVKAMLVACAARCHATKKGLATRWVSISLQLDACTCHARCGALKLGPRVWRGEVLLRLLTTTHVVLRPTWTEEPSAWFAAPAMALKTRTRRPPPTRADH